MKVVLINPTFHTYFSLGLSYGEPLGLAYIAAAILRDTKHEVEIVDSVGMATEFKKVDKRIQVGLANDELLGLLRDKGVGTLGVSLITSHYSDEILDFITQLKAQHPQTPIIIGGAHATLEWQRCLAHPAVDFIVMGEGEATIVELLDAIENMRPIREVAGIAFRDQNGIAVRTANRAPVDIDTLHFSKVDLERIRQDALWRFNKARLKRFLDPRYVLNDFLPKLKDPERLRLFIRRMLFGLFRPFYRNL